MGLGTLSGKGRMPDDAARELLAGGFPLALRFDEAAPGEDPAIKGFLLVDALGTKAGTRVVVRQSEAFRSSRGSLAEALAGSDRVAPLVKGDVVAFSSAYVDGGVARVGAITARVHDRLLGEVQVFTAMARPSQSRVSKKGAMQSLTVADGKAAAVARNAGDVAEAFAAAKGRAWPGGAAGLILRDRKGGTGEFFEEKDAGIDFLLQELSHSGAFAQKDDVLEVIPAWRLPMGRDQVVKDVDPRVETQKPVSGTFTMQFEPKKSRGQGFLPCLVVACDEEEWAFGGKTGKKVRVASAVQPIFRREPVMADRLPSSVRAYGGNVNTVLSLYAAAELSAMAAARADRRGPDPEPARREEGGQDEYRPPMPKFAFGRR